VNGVLKILALQNKLAFMLDLKRSQMSSNEGGKGLILGEKATHLSKRHSCIQSYLQSSNRDSMRDENVIRQGLTLSGK